MKKLLFLFIDTFYTGPLKLTDENGNEWRGDDNG